MSQFEEIPQKDILQIKASESGGGNSISVPYSFIESRIEVFQASSIPIFAIEKMPDGRFEAKRCTIDDLRLSAKFDQKQLFAIPKDWESRVQRLKPSQAFTTKLDSYLAMEPQKRTEAVREFKNTLSELKKKDDPPMAKAKVIMDAIENVFVLNKASLKLEKKDISQNEKELANETEHMIAQALSLVEDSDITSKLFEAFAGLSNGQTLNHINRVFTSMASFLHYMNKLHDKRISQSLRLVFNDHYRDWYKKKLPHLTDQYLVSDNIVQIQRLEPPRLKEWALGAFLHDIGKIANFDYFESEQGFNFQEIKQHVFISSGLVLMNYGLDHEEARLMAGDHHNALFHSDGYGVTRFERERGMRKLGEAERCISTSPDDYILGKSMSFLPIEMLAVCDVYDAMIDDSRTYKAPLSTSEALDFMKTKLVDNEKLDPIIFDIFVDFLKEKGFAVPTSLGLSEKIKLRKS